MTLVELNHEELKKARESYQKLVSLNKALDKILDELEKQEGRKKASRALIKAIRLSGTKR